MAGFSLPSDAETIPVCRLSCGARLALDELEKAVISCIWQ